jgi:hypothetical protein
MFIGVLFYRKCLVSFEEIILFWVFIIKARLAEEIVFTVMTLDISNLLLAYATINDQESFGVTDLTKPILQNISFEIMECFSKQSNLELLIKRELKLFLDSIVILLIKPFFHKMSKLWISSLLDNFLHHLCWHSLGHGNFLFVQHLEKLPFSFHLQELGLFIYFLETLVLS